MNKKSLILTAILFVMLVPIVSAQTNSTTESAKPQLRELPKEKQAILKDRLVAQKVVRKEYEEMSREKKEEMRAKLQAIREDFREKLAGLKDERKKSIIERVDLNLSTINQNSTNRMNSSIEKLEVLLDKFASRGAILKLEGKDTSEVDNAILAAESAIASAKEAVATQSAKEYVAEISDETTLKNNVGQAVKSLRQDLKIAHDAVKIAKQKVIDVARALAKLKLNPVTPGAESSESATPNI